MSTISFSASSSLDVRVTYEKTAPMYDQLTAHHDYELWLGNLLPALERHGLRHGRLLDVACGTGKSFLGMLSRGWVVEAVDISPLMLKQARQKVGPEVVLHALDMRRLPYLGNFDLVWCLDDGMNYLLSADDLQASLSGMGANLRSGGLCVFDVNTLACYRDFFARTDRISGDGVELVWRGQATGAFESGGVASATLEAIDQDGVVSAPITHLQRHFSSQEITDAIEAAGLTLLAEYGITTDAVLEAPVDEIRHTKAIYVVRPGEGR